MNFLIIVYKGIGDVILTTPLIKAIKRNFYDSKVYFLTKKYSSAILSNNPYIEEVLVREEMSLSYLRSLKIDVSIDCMLSSSSAFFSIMSGAKKRIAFWRNWGIFAYNSMIKSEWEGYNVIKRLEYLKVLGIDWKGIKDIKPEIYPSDKDYSRIKDIFVNFSIDIPKDKIASFDITSPRPERQPDAGIFIYSADRLIEMGWKTIFMPAPWDADYVKKSIDKYSKYPKLHAVIENLSLLETSAAISLSTLHIGTSSAPMHMAVAFDVATFTLYTPAVNPYSWSPPHQHHGWIWKEIEKMESSQVWFEIKKHIDTLKL